MRVLHFGTITEDEHGHFILDQFAFDCQGESALIYNGNKFEYTRYLRAIAEYILAKTTTSTTSPEGE